MNNKVEWKTANEKKAAQLGMSGGKAYHKLRKKILFYYIKKAGNNICYRCEKKINDIDDFSIDHKKHWLNNNIKLFWNIRNIAFSHLKCNLKSKNHSYKRDCIKGKFWCIKCKKFKPKKDFIPSRNYKFQYCKECKRKYGYIWRRKNNWKS